MKFALDKRGRVVLASALGLGFATVAWTQLNGDPAAEWQDEIQASAPAENALPAEDDVLPPFKMEASRDRIPAYSKLIASEDTHARRRQAQQDPLSVLDDEDEQAALNGALSQQSSVKIGAIVAGSGQFSPNAAPQYYAANARASLEGGGGGAGGVAQPKPEGKDPGKVETPEPPEPPIRDIPKDCDGLVAGKPAKDCVTAGGETPPPSEGEKPADPDTAKPGDEGDKGNGGEKPKPVVAVDEPGSFALFSLGLLGLVAMYRRRQRQA